MDVRATTPLLPTGLDITAAAEMSRQGKGRSLEQVAGQFESMFLSLIVKEMRQTLEPGGLFGNDGADIRGGLFDLYLGQHLAKAGGLGLAAMLRRHLKAQTPDDSAPATHVASPHST